MKIRKGGLDDPQIVDLLRLHPAAAFENSPPGSVHALGLSRLRDPAVTF